MSKTDNFIAVHPVLPVRDVKRSLEYYIDNLGFSLAFIDDPEKPLYAGIVRDSIQIHLQWHQEENWQQMNACSLRFVINDVASLFNEYEGKDIFHEQTQIRKTTWGTAEFAFYDPDMNGLTFYRVL